MGESQPTAIVAGTGLNAAVVGPLVVVAARAVLGLPFGRISGFDRVKPAYLLPPAQTSRPRKGDRGTMNAVVGPALRG